MGVKELWSILDPTADICTLADLHGKCLAVDISGWIFQTKEAQKLAGKDGFHPHLRILFWRLYHLTRNQVRLLVVFDGPCPNLKAAAVAKRGRKPSMSMNNNGNSKFQSWVEECKELLSVFKIPYLVGEGDAEATCADLNQKGNYSETFALSMEALGNRNSFKEWDIDEEKPEISLALSGRGKVIQIEGPTTANAGCWAKAVLVQGTKIVDGCITEDSDVFLFGAKTVYRHFSCDPKKVKSLKCYRMESVQQKLHLSRDHLISLALLLGCDYGLGGVRGIGREQAIKLMQLWENVNPLDRMTKWRQDSSCEQSVTYKVITTARKPVHCRRCGHQGSGVNHGVTGCGTCGLQNGCKKTAVDSTERICQCDWHQNITKQQSSLIEAKIKDFALKDPLFPRKELITQYLAPTASNSIELEWLRPSYGEVEKYLSRLFKWDQKKILNQLASYFTAHDMCTLTRNQVSGDSYPEGFSRPDKILAKRQENHREIYVVEWKHIPGLPMSGEEKITTREFKDNFSAVYPQVAANYEGWLTHSSTPTRSPNRKRPFPNTPAGRQTTMDRYCVARKRLFLPLKTADQTSGSD